MALLRPSIQMYVKSIQPFSLTDHSNVPTRFPLKFESVCSIKLHLAQQIEQELNLLYISMC